MKVFRDLYITGDDARLGRVVAAIEAALADGWTHDPASEERVGFVSATSTMYYITRRRSPRHTSGWRWTPTRTVSTPRTLRPPTRGEHSTDAYNAVVRTFYDRLAAPTAANAGARERGDQRQGEIT